MTNFDQIWDQHNFDQTFFYLKQIFGICFLSIWKSAI